MKPREFIDDLGTKTTEEIRALCVEKGYKGEGGKPRRCPAAVMIKEETGYAVAVGSDDIDWTENGFYHRYEPLPPSLHDFIYAVDLESYPELMFPGTPDNDE